MESGKRLLETKQEEYSHTFKKVRGNNFYDDVFEDSQPDIYTTPSIYEKDASFEAVEKGIVSEKIAPSSAMLYNVFKDIAFPCQSCKEVCLTAEELKNHEQAEHFQVHADKEDVLHQAHYSGDIMLPFQLQEPMQQNVTEGANTAAVIDALLERISFRCLLCKELFLTEDELKAHEQVCSIPGLIHKDNEEDSLVDQELLSSFKYDDSASNSFQESDTISPGKKELPYTDDNIGQESLGNKEHEITHTKEEPYSCDKCQKRFARKWEWQRHKMSQMYIEDLCAQKTSPCAK